MEYVVQTAGILGEAIPILVVADAIARVIATGRGTAPFNRAAYKRSFDSACARLLRDAEAETLRVCDDQSHPATPAAIYARAGTAPDNGPGRAAHLYTRIAYLNKWACGEGDSYALHPVAGPWIEGIATGTDLSGKVRFIEDVIEHSGGVKTTAIKSGESAWLVPDPRDAHLDPPEHAWYTPARYFAREFVKVDPSLLQKRESLAEKVAIQMGAVGIYKRGRGKNLYSSGSVLKAFSNVTLY